MEEWYRIVRNLEDESEDAYTTQQFTKYVYTDLRLIKIKEKQKFKNRMGREFEVWVATLTQQYPVDLVTEIINDDVFWETTLKLTLGV
jgi:hypothetical protein